MLFYGVNIEFKQTTEYSKLCRTKELYNNRNMKNNDFHQTLQPRLYLVKKTKHHWCISFNIPMFTEQKIQIHGPHAQSLSFKLSFHKYTIK